MRRPRAIAAVLLLAAAQAAAFSWWTDSLSSAWTAAPMALDGKDEPWFGGPELDEAQVIVRARNDSRTLYLLLVAEGLDGRALWSGAYRQDATIWFMDSKGESELWGVRFPFSRVASPLKPAFLTDDDFAASPALAPEWVSGVDASTAPLPGDVGYATGGSGKNPVWELSVPLSRLSQGAGGTLSLRLVSAPVSRSVRSFYSGRPGRARAAGHGRRGGYEEMPDEAPGPLYPSPLSLRVRVRLAARPAPPHS